MTSRTPDWQIAAEAADWAVRIDSGPLNAGERATLATWLKTSPVHVEELLLSASLMAGLARVDGARALSVEELLADTAPEVITLFQRPDGNESLGRGVQEAPADEPGERKPWTRYWPALAASLLLALAVSWYGLRPGPAPDGGIVVAEAQLFAAPERDLRSIALEDGSVMLLNADSRARVAISDTSRLVELVGGAARFDVTHDPGRAFRVLAAGTVIQVVGTKFTVERRDGAVTVQVIDGEVLVGNRREVLAAADAGPGSEAIADSPIVGELARLAAGQEARFLPGGESRIAAAATASAAAWPSRQLTFRDEGLSVIAAEFNRYNSDKIVVADAALARTRFSGVFDAHDPESFIDFLELSADVRVERPRDGQVVLSAAD